jgi:hypothetical protein
MLSYLTIHEVCVAYETLNSCSRRYSSEQEWIGKVYLRTQDGER